MASEKRGGSGSRAAARRRLAHEGLVPNLSLNVAHALGHETEDEIVLERQELHRPPEERDFREGDPWRALRIQGEFVKGFDTLARITKAVTIFGSARVRPESPEY